MGLASAIGQTFNFPARQAPTQQQGVSQAGEGQGSILGAPPSGLENVDNQTKAFYDKWYQLEDFASQMKLQYGIDVTKPDFSSEEGMQAHSMFQKALADLNYQGNRMKQAQKDLDLYNKARLSTYGNRVGYEGQIGQEVFDPNKITMDAGYQADPSGLSRQNYLQSVALEKQKQAGREKLADIKKTNKEADYQPYEKLMKDAGAIVTGALDDFGDVDEDGFRHSNKWNNVAFGSMPNQKKVVGIKQDAETGDMFIDLTDSKGFNRESIPATEDNMKEIVDAYILGQKGEYKAEVFNKYQEYLDENQIPNSSFFPKGYESYRKKREESATKAKVTKIESQISELGDDKLNKYSTKTKELMQDALVGSMITSPDGSEGKVVSIEHETAWGSGKYIVALEGGKSFNIGGAASDNNHLIQSALKNKIKNIGGGKKSNKDSGNTEPTNKKNLTEEEYNALPSGAEFYYNGKKLIKQ